MIVRAPSVVILRSFIHGVLGALLFVAASMGHVHAQPISTDQTDQAEKNTRQAAKPAKRPKQLQQGSAPQRTRHDTAKNSISNVR